MVHSNRTNKIRLQTSKWQANARQSNRSTNKSYFMKPYIKARTSAKVRVVKYHLIKTSKDAWEALTRACATMYRISTKSRDFWPEQMHVPKNKTVNIHRVTNQISYAHSENRPQHRSLHLPTAQNLGCVAH